MTFEQKIQLGILIGTWVAGLATFLAVMTSLYLARRGEKARLKIWVGIRTIIRGESPGKDHMCFSVTNEGDRPVIIQNTVGWVVGKRKKRKYGVQILSGHSAKQGPIEITHGQNAMLTEPLQSVNFNMLFDDTSAESLKTLRAQVFTTVETFEVKPESQLIDWFRDRIAKRTA